MKQLQFSFVEDLLTPMELIEKYIGEESAREFNEHFLKLVMTIVK